ncbi:MAG: hypothetical protein QOC63_5088, partial [Mycobacterium sp.]|nr:hypothetical protein [Mycobacterium sp.]
MAKLSTTSQFPVAFLDISFTSGVRGIAFRSPGRRVRPPYLAESPELHPTDNLAGTA